MKFIRPKEPVESKESKDSVNLKHAKVYILGFILGILLLSLILPKKCPIYIETTAYEYVLGQEEPVAEYEVFIEGHYTRRQIREDVFEGQLVISGFPETDGASAYIQFLRGNDFGVISYQQDGIPVWDTPLKQIYNNLDFSLFVIQLFEVSQDGDAVHGSWDAETGRVLSTATDYTALTELCEVLGMGLIPQ